MGARWSKSLRLRLLAGILVTLLLSWLIQFSLYWTSVSRENTGERDRDLLAAAQLALPMVAAAVRDSAVKETVLPAESNWKNPAAKRALLAFDLTRGYLVFRSADAPSALVADLGVEGFYTRSVDGEEWRVYSDIDPQNLARIVVAAPVAGYREQFLNRLAFGAIVMLLMTVAVGGGAAVIASVALKPVSAIARVLLDRSPTDLRPLSEARVPVEIQPLIAAFNQQQRRLQAVMDNERSFLSNAAHELRTPIAVISVQAENALRANDAAEAQESLSKVMEATQRSARLAEQLLDLARAESGHAAAVSSVVALHEVIELVLKDMYLLAKQRNQHVALDLRRCAVVGNVDSLGILVRNLLDNASRYSGPSSSILVQCLRLDGGVTLLVADDGPGVPVDERRKIFDRFYRAPGTLGQGSGIGLALVRSIAAQHQATVETSAGIGGRGISFSVSFPSA